jgi:ATP-dependent DNA helicase RecG
MNLNTPVKELFMVGPIYAKRLEKLNIKTVEDLLYHFPFRYIDYSLISPICRVQPGEIVTIQGEIISMKNEYTKYGKKIQKAQVSDGTGKIGIVWFNQPFLIKIIKVGEQYSFSGKIDWFGHSLVMVSPEYEIQKPQTIHTGRLSPIYPETRGVTSKWLRSRISWLIKKSAHQIEDILPSEIRKKYDLLDFVNAIEQIHFPKTLKEAETARNRFAFEELFLLQLATLKRKVSWKKKKSPFKLLTDQEKILEFIRRLPFELTLAQKKCLKEILNDLNRPQPMNRLLQGDVGSGKTVVAAVAIYISFLNGIQSVLMAPTEILANQHYQTLNQLLTPWGVKIALLTGSKKDFPLRPNLPPDLIVGTHALIYQRANFNKLGLVIIDEQHRFGVEQRGKLIKKGQAPHLLTMTATPIPRTIALTLYGDLDLSVIDQMPPGRIRVKTWVVPPQKRNAAYDWIRKKVKNTPEQCFIICPLIEESETFQTVRAATVEFERLKTQVFPELRLGLLHGRMKTSQKDEVVRKFREGKLDILVSTPVVEVGIDIPQATIMMIEGADRFGLAQLHQLRGRVGRGQRESYCLLFTEMTSGKPLQRLKALEKLHIGMELAELDLKIRGPGEIYGTVQHGFFKLKVASFADLPLIEKTRVAAKEILPHLAQYPLLQAKLKKDTIKPIEPN